jgi:hypothetical protein
VSWQRNVFAIATASFVGFTGFTVVMPFLPLSRHMAAAAPVRATAPVTEDI